MDKYGLTNETDYDPTITAFMAQEMTSGAFRILHNIIPAQFKYVFNDNEKFLVKNKKWLNLN